MIFIVSPFSVLHHQKKGRLRRNGKRSSEKFLRNKKQELKRQQRPGRKDRRQQRPRRKERRRQRPKAKRNEKQKERRERKGKAKRGKKVRSDGKEEMRKMSTVKR
jgi:colicin import membrane protein